MFAALVERGVTRDDPVWQERVAGALMHEAYALAQLGRIEEAVLAHFELVGRFGESDVPQVRAWVAGGLYSMAVANVRLGRPDEAVAAFDDLLARFGDDRSDEIRPLVVSALVARGCEPCRAGRLDEALDDFDRALAIARGGRIVERAQAAQALAHRAWALKQLGRDDEAIAAYEELVDALRRRRASDVPAARRVGPAQRRHRAGADAAATRASVEKYEEVFARFRDDPDRRGALPRRSRPLLHRAAARTDRASAPRREPSSSRSSSSTATSRRASPRAPSTARGSGSAG